MAERFKAHAWKACWVQALGGSNPPPSANFRRRQFSLTFQGLTRLEAFGFPTRFPHTFGRDWQPALDERIPVGGFQNPSCGSAQGVLLSTCQFQTLFLLRLSIPE